MPKQKYVLSKKHEYLIDYITKLPSLSDDNFFGGNSDIEKQSRTILICFDVIKMLTKNTKLEHSAIEFCNKAGKIFDKDFIGVTELNEERIRI